MVMIIGEQPHQVAPSHQTLLEKKRKLFSESRSAAESTTVNSPPTLNQQQVPRIPEYQEVVGRHRLAETRRTLSSTDITHVGMENTRSSQKVSDAYSPIPLVNKKQDVSVLVRAISKPIGNSGTSNIRRDRSTSRSVSVTGRFVVSTDKLPKYERSNSTLSTTLSAPFLEECRVTDSPILSGVTRGRLATPRNNASMDMAFCGTDLFEKAGVDASHFLSDDISVTGREENILSCTPQKSNTSNISTNSGAITSSISAVNVRPNGVRHRSASMRKGRFTVFSDSTDSLPEVNLGGTVAVGSNMTIANGTGMGVHRNSTTNSGAATPNMRYRPTSLTGRDSEDVATYLHSHLQSPNSSLLPASRDASPHVYGKGSQEPMKITRLGSRDAIGADSNFNAKGFTKMNEKFQQVLNQQTEILEVIRNVKLTCERNTRAIEGSQSNQHMIKSILVKRLNNNDAKNRRTNEMVGTEATAISKFPCYNRLR
ncbi:hypothetical protein SARC_05487 [Sphaeroforma arctica JP610]|uniref:Uncharacterized protein n=1 Tax=Sphaeroforma arctica JP610 TaxID=667725 RepID=A0A0L0FZH4_9EUKA|nr:hypothetical protein SARC_05487 [Sphaeroforma arctica JP610]KNC82220.1 hypothetical protein SARC_05487 [Sphaeroforma arctica JP610]|eukprot:XP_014156122.1 hypothetical protein SARC_05487 [Sphaeroforma arctica JP610]